MDEPNYNPYHAGRPRANLPGLNESPGIPLELDTKGWPLKTIANFYTALEWDYEFSKVKYNELAQCVEYHDYDDRFRPIIRRWTDKDLAWAEQHLEVAYGLYSPARMQSALRLFYHQRAYHPIRRRLEETQWDGTARMEGFLTSRAASSTTCPCSSACRAAARARSCAGSPWRTTGSPRSP